MNNLLVIDGDNISVMIFKQFWETNTIQFKDKIVYGDFSLSEMTRWQKFIVENNFKTFHCPKTGKKQTTDINMAIDIMNKLYTQNYDTIYIATHDCDFVPLANQWLQKDKNVFFIGTKSTSKIITNNFNFILLQKNINSNNSITSTNSINSNNNEIKNKNHISDYILEYLKNNPETNISNIRDYIKNNYQLDVRKKRVIKFINKIETNYLWIKNDDIFYYPKLQDIFEIINQKNIKTNKTILKYITKVYPYFSLDISEI